MTYTLVHSILQTPIRLSPLAPNRLVIENPTMFASLAQQLYGQCRGGEGAFVLSDTQERRLCDVAEMVVDHFSLDLNTKVLQNGLYKRLAALGQEDKHKWDQWYVQIIQEFERLAMSLPLQLQYADPPAPTAYCKLCSVAFAELPESPPEKLATYLTALAELTDVRIFITVNLQAYLDEEQMRLLAQHCAYLEICWLRLECAYRPEDGVKTILIDDSLCEILVNYPKME